MKTFDERRKSVEQYMTRIRKNRKKGIFVATSLCLVLALALVLFIPYDTTPPSVEKYRNDDYYDLIQKINLATFEAPKENSRFESLVTALGDITNGINKNETMMPGATMAGSIPMHDAAGESGEYVEVTDNQVSGVIESDIFKRSSEYIFYLRENRLSVYSIAQEESTLVGSFEVEKTQFEQDSDEYGQFLLFECQEMYLSMDCRTITIICRSFHKTTGTSTEVISLDVTDPANITETNRVFMSGSYQSSRMVDGKLLVMSLHRIDESNVDFDDPTTFVPQVGTEQELELIAPENIKSPESLSHLTYTVISVMDEKTLEVGGSAAVLSYSDQIYVSQDTVYVTRAFTHTSEKNAGGCYTQTTQTEITGVRYADGELTFAGSVTVDGSVKNQYSMDQHNGILRVVTSTFSRGYKEYGDQYTSSVLILESKRNVDLYCVDLESWEIAASVIGFAPNGEDAQSVRFDGDKAYVCTAVIITLTDPVYFFDLSDLSNITYTDTGTIDGYSTSLIQLGDGYLLGIGYGENWQLKVEVYEEVAGQVVSVCAYERDADFSQEYKSYYIDRENDLIGLAVHNWIGGTQYILLHFDGCELRPIATEFCYGSLDYVRATIVDGWLYVLSEDFAVQQVW